MTMLLQECEMPIADCLQLCAETVFPLDGHGWQFELADVAQPVTARQEGEWLRFCAPLGPPAGHEYAVPGRPCPADLQRMLACNAGLAAAAKFTLADDPPTACLAAELLLGEDEADLTERIGRLCDGFSRAAAEFAAGRRSDGSPVARTSHGGQLSGELGPDLVSLCKETGWSLAQRAADCVVFELDLSGAFFQAVAQSHGGAPGNRVGGLRLGVNLANAAELDAGRRHALAVLLLHASHCVRMARATVQNKDGVTAYGWDVVLDRVTKAEEIEHALAALTVACRISAREVAAFQQDDCLARSYLMFRGWCL